MPDTFPNLDPLRDSAGRLNCRSFSGSQLDPRRPGGDLGGRLLWKAFLLHGDRWHEWFATVLRKLWGGTTRPSDLI